MFNWSFTAKNKICFQSSLILSWYFIWCIVCCNPKVWINAGDIILIGLRDYQDTKADVILKYNSDEARNLKAYGELPENGEITDFTYNIHCVHEKMPPPSMLKNFQN